MNNISNTLDGINCEMKDCIYHNGLYNCTAKFINIKPTNTLVGSNVVCDTFQQK